MIFTGEIFSVFIIVIAAIETAIGLCIILSYYKISNKNIATNLRIETFLSVIVAIGDFPPFRLLGMLFNTYLQ